jgi:hypothetical protein
MMHTLFAFAPLIIVAIFVFILGAVIIYHDNKKCGHEHKGH